MAEIKKSRNKIQWEHVAVYPDNFAEFRRLRNLRTDRPTDNTFFGLLLTVYKKWNGAVK